MTGTLRNGKTIIFSEYGWHQPNDQHSAMGDLTVEEADEAWGLWETAP